MWISMLENPKLWEKLRKRFEKQRKQQPTENQKNIKYRTINGGPNFTFSLQ